MSICIWYVPVSDTANYGPHKGSIHFERSCTTKEREETIMLEKRIISGITEYAGIVI